MNLICVEDGIDSSKDSGKLMIYVLSAVTEIEGLEKQHRQLTGAKARLGQQMDSLDPALRSNIIASNACKIICLIP